MHQPARLPENLTKFSQNTPVLGFGTEHPPPPKLKFFPEFQVQPYTEPPPHMENSNFLSRVQIWAYTAPPPPPQWRLKYVETVSPKDTISFIHVAVDETFLGTDNSTTQLKGVTE